MRAKVNHVDFTEDEVCDVEHEICGCKDICQWYKVDYVNADKDPRLKEAALKLLKLRKYGSRFRRRE
jgi:hypothetical protein